MHWITMMFAATNMFFQGGIRFEDQGWSYQELWRHSDLVVIGTASPAAPVANTDSFLPKFLQQLETDVKVAAVLKGTLKAEAQSVTLVHFRYRDDVEIRLGNGPQFIVMGTEPHGLVVDRKPHYLLFLRSREDNRFEPVSGNMKPTASVVRLLEYPEKDPALDRTKAK